MADLWGFCENKAVLPQKAQIAAALILSALFLTHPYMDVILSFVAA